MDTTITIETLLGIGQGLGSPVLGEAADRWPSWTRDYPALAVVSGPAQLEGWISARREAGELDAVDAVLSALGQVAARESESAAAVAVLGWLFRRAARALVRGLAHVAAEEGEIEQLVAANFWLVCRRMPPWPHRVAANLLGTVRRRVLIDARGGGRQDRTWEVTALVDPADLAAVERAPERSDQVVYELLGQAAQERVLSATELALVVHMLQVSDRHEPARGGGRWGGLVTRRAAHEIADSRGVTATTARRHMTAALRSLADAYGPVSMMRASA